MTDLLTDLLHERADALPAPQLDLDRLVRDGERRVRGRRTALVGGVAALAVVSAVAIPALVGGLTTGPETRPATGGGTQPASWAVGSTIHFGDRAVDVGHQVGAYVVTDAGAVVSDPGGSVWSVEGDDVTPVGRIDPKAARLVADGSRVAWVEPLSGEGPEEFRVLDQATGEILRGPVDARSTGSAVLAIDGDVLYTQTDQRSTAAWNFAQGRSWTVSRTEDWTVADARGGRVVSRNDHTSVIRVGARPGQGSVLHLSSAYVLSPDGHYLIGARDPGDVGIFDTSTGEAMPEDDLGYASFFPYQWLDDDHFAALGYDSTASDAPRDVLTCVAATGQCTVTVDNAGSEADGFRSPLGWAAPD